MTRKQAEKYADAIRRVAEGAGAAWETTSMTTADVAAVLKKRPEEVEAALATDGAAIWGCLPIGWRLGMRGATGIAVSRPSRGA